MKKQIEINKISLTLFYAKEKHYENINAILNAMENDEIILSWNLNDNKEYEISYLYSKDKDFILELIEKANKVKFQGCTPIELKECEVGMKYITYKEKATLILK